MWVDILKWTTDEGRVQMSYFFIICQMSSVECV